MTVNSYRSFVKSSYTSDELMHFVGRGSPTDHAANFATLLKVLKSGCISYPPSFPRDWELKLTFRPDRSLLSEELIVPTVTCYCDIPFDHLGIHMLKYGMFGLSFDRSLLVKYGARPVIYVPLFRQDFLSISGRSLIMHIEQIYRGFRELLVDPLTDKNKQSSYSLGKKPEDADHAIREMDSIFTKDFLAFLKPFDAELAAEDPDNFYMEREWRKFGSFRFSSNDVRHVLIARGFVGQLIEQLPVYSEKIFIAPEAV